jgi:hypothetical protein
MKGGHREGAEQPRDGGRIVLAMRTDAHNTKVTVNTTSSDRASRRANMGTSDERQRPRNEWALGTIRTMSSAVTAEDRPVGS